MKSVGVSLGMRILKNLVAMIGSVLLLGVLCRLVCKYITAHTHGVPNGPVLWSGIIGNIKHSVRFIRSKKLNSHLTDSQRILKSWQIY